MHKQIFNEDNKVFFENLASKSYYKIFAATQENNIVAYCIISELGDEAELINIATKQEFRKNGIAKNLLTFAIDNTNASTYFLEVSTDNVAAIKLYNSVGFAEISRRKKYYGNTDAIIMRKQKTV